MLGIGRRIKYYREQKNLTQQELADIMGYKSKSTIGKIETGVNDINQSTAVKFAKALNVPVSDLLGFNNSPNQDIIVDFINNNPEYHVVVEKMMDVKPEDIHLLVEIIDRFIAK